MRSVSDTVGDAFTVPGTSEALHISRTAQGKLATVDLAGRRYLERRGDALIFDDGFVEMAEIDGEGGRTRSVRARGKDWIEGYRWDSLGRPTFVDGMEIRRDDRQRLVACSDGVLEWRYGYAGDRLAVIDGPLGSRTIVHGADGRPVRVRDRHGLVDLSYAGDVRSDIEPVPDVWSRDALGRLWTIKDSCGRVVTTYLWDGFACLGRIDGAPGAPLAAVFSLDPSFTPVRVIDRDGVRRVPRDAFGEGLLEEPGVPGLFGGAVHRRHVYYRSRVLDPRAAAYDKPDPFDGSERDPRRGSGDQGPLVIETPPGGPYSVCSHDPVGRADPTGEVSGWLILSTLTWSLGNNLLGWFGMDFTINFWTSLFGSIFDGNLLSRFFTFEGYSARRSGAFAVRRDGIWAKHDSGRVWTFQHQVWVPGDEVNKLDDARLALPDGFQPTLYGTLLRGVVPGSQPFLLSGGWSQRLPANRAALGWTRAGGPGSAALPGSRTTTYPSGAFHFDRSVEGLRTPAKGTLTELEPRGAPIAALSTAAEVAVSVPSAPALNMADIVVLTDGANRIAIASIVSVTPDGSGRSRLVLSAEAIGLGPTGVRLRGTGFLGAGWGVAQNAVNDGEGIRITAPNPSGIVRDQPVVLSQNGVAVGAALALRLDVRMNVDAPIDAATVRPITLRSMTEDVAGNGTGTIVTRVDRRGLQITSSPPDPPTGEISIRLPAPAMQVWAVRAEVSGGDLLFDRTDNLPADGTLVEWRYLRNPSVAAVGNIPNDVPILTGTQLQYEPVAPAAAAGIQFVLLENAAVPPLRMVRANRGALWDAVLFDRLLPGEAGVAYSAAVHSFDDIDFTGLTMDTLSALTLDPGSVVPAEITAVHLYQLTDPALVAGDPSGIPALVVASPDTLTVSAASFADRHRPGPGELVVLRSGAAIQAAVIASMTLEVSFDRGVVVPVGGQEVAPIGPTGHTYIADRIDDFVLRLQPQVEVLPAPPALPAAVDVQFPRPRVDELYRVTFRELVGGTRIRLFRVSAVDGTTITCEGDVAVPATATPNSIRVQRLDILDPGSGTARLGTDGTPINGAPQADGRVNASRFRFRVWRASSFDDPNIVPANRSMFALVSEGKAWPLRAVNAPQQTLEIRLTAPTTLASPVEITLHALTTPGGGPLGLAGIAAAASVVMAGNEMRIDQVTPPLPSSGAVPVIVVCFVPTARSASCELGPGTVLVPQDPENWELTRRESLIEHELTHTHQCATLGPIVLTMIPKFLIWDLPVELGTGFESPRFSELVSATVVREGASTLFLEIPADSRVSFTSGHAVQIFHGSPSPASATLRTRDGQRFSLQTSDALPWTSGQTRMPVSIRQQTVNTAWHVVSGVLNGTTVGGVLNNVVGFTWGGLFLGLGKLFYALGRLIGGAGRTYPAHVRVRDEEQSVVLDDDSGVREFPRRMHVLIRSGNTTVVKEVAPLGRELLLLGHVSFEGAVQVAPYTTHDPGSHWDWLDYYPARLPDETRATEIELQTIGEGSSAQRLTLAPFDRVRVLVGNQTRTTLVTAVNAGRVQLEDPLPFDPAGSERSLRIAKVDSSDPLGDLTWPLSMMGMGWMRWLFDPYGQIHRRVAPQRGSVWDWVLRIGRYLLSTRSWNNPIGILAWVLLDRPPFRSHEFLSCMEQDASENSGDLYSPIGRLRGEATGSPPTAVVGDVMRYWYFLNNREGSMLSGSRAFAPGSSVQRIARLVPFLTAAGTGTNAPNTNVDSGPNPATAVPDIFVEKIAAGLDASDPLAAATGAPGPVGFVPSELAIVPTSVSLERCVAVYASFTRPGNHRITIRNVERGADESDDGWNGRDERIGQIAQEAGAQTLWYDVTVSDVTVRAVARDLAENDRVSLVLTQRARFAVTPDGQRSYSASLLQPGSGALLRRGDSELEIVARVTSGSEPLEISRLHRPDAAGAFPSGGLAQHGLLLPLDVHVPVRRLVVEVVSSIPVRERIEVAVPDPPLGARHAGQEVFLLIPAVLQAAGVTAVLVYETDVPLPGATPVLPVPRFDSPDGEAVREFLGPLGTVRSFHINPDDPPEVAVRVDFTIPVGVDPDLATLTASIRYEPTFSLDGVFEVPRGTDLVLTCGGGASPRDVRGPAGGTAVIEGNRITIQTGAVVAGEYQVLVENANDTTQWSRRTVRIT